MALGWGLTRRGATRGLTVFGRQNNPNDLINCRSATIKHAILLFLPIIKLWITDKNDCHGETNYYGINGILSLLYCFFPTHKILNNRVTWLLSSLKNSSRVYTSHECGENNASFLRSAYHRSFRANRVLLRKFLNPCKNLILVILEIEKLEKPWQCLSYYFAKEAYAKTPSFMYNDESF